MIFKIILCNNPKAAARCSRPLCSSQSTGGPSIRNPNRGNRKRPRVTDCALDPKASAHPVPQDPTACRCDIRHPPRSHRKRRTREEKHRSHHVKCSTHELPAKNVCLRSGFWTPKSQMLLRKEVIQPHLPVRLPCYDLVLITDPTFDGSLHKG